MTLAAPDLPYIMPILFKQFPIFYVGSQICNIPLPGRGVHRPRPVAHDGGRSRCRRVRQTSNHRRVFRKQSVGSSGRRLAPVTRRVPLPVGLARLRRWQQVNESNHGTLKMG